ncbi:MAG: DUF423 domain-containing protein [Chthoniobacterales bacterium]
MSAIRIAAVLGLTGVALGAFGAHGLAGLLEANGRVGNWETAAFYHLVHAVALLALALAGRADRWMTGLWTGGVLVFSGSLYLLAVTNVGWLGAITPIGGTALIAGWGLLLFRGK